MTRAATTHAPALPPFVVLMCGRRQLLSTTPAAPSTTALVVLGIVGGLVLLAIAACIIYHCARSISAKRDARDRIAWKAQEAAEYQAFIAGLTPEQRELRRQNVERARRQLIADNEARTARDVAEQAEWRRKTAKIQADQARIAAGTAVYAVPNTPIG